LIATVQTWTSTTALPRLFVDAGARVTAFSPGPVGLSPGVIERLNSRGTRTSPPSKLRYCRHRLSRRHRSSRLHRSGAERRNPAIRARADRVARLRIVGARTVFVGISAAKTFGPLQRFAFGAAFAAKSWNAPFAMRR
jgi:hypothetical protein